MRIIPLLMLLTAAGPAFAEGQRAVFESKHTSQRWTLQDFDPALPEDWTGYGFLVLELRLSSPQRFDLKLHTGDGVRSVRLSPVPGAWIRSAVPLDFLRQEPRSGNDLAAVHNKPRAMMFINLSGSVGPLRSVQAIEASMPSPIGTVTLEIRSLRLGKEDLGDVFLEPKPLVDELGQWIHDDWPGKPKNLEQLKAAWAAEEKSLPAGTATAACRYGGYAATKARATGFFRVEKVDGKWWFVDPDGHLFFSAGADVMTPSMPTMAKGREELFAAIPPADLAAGRGARSGASFYTWNLSRRWGADWPEKWVDLTARRMTSWGLNTVGNWSDPRLAGAQRVPYVTSVAIRGVATGPMGIADVYAPDFAATVDQAAAQQCASRKDDPYLLGYFLGNEPPWPGRESVAVDAILSGPSSALQREAKEYLATSDTAARRQEFLYRTYRKFVETVTAAIRKHDPKHLILGLRFGSSTPVEVIRASDVFDVYSLNSYGYTVSQTELDKVKRTLDRPILIGEFHFGSPGRGMTPGLRQVRNQEERGVAYRYYVENAAADPAVVGTHWFQWIDEPSTGRFDGENYNIGVVDVTDRPYAEMVDAMRITHGRLLEIHSGKSKPVTRQALVQ